MTCVRILLVWCVCVISSFGFSQKYQDTTYYDFDWNHLPTRNGAFFYRICEKAKGRFLVKDYFIGGQIQMIGRYRDKDFEIEDGRFVYYNIAGGKTRDIAYKKGNYHGLCTWYHATGEKSSVEYYRKGKQKRMELYNPDGTVDSLSVDPNSDAQFPGGKSAYDNFISENLVGPSQELSNLHEKVIVTARIDQDGNVIDINLGHYISQEIADLILKMMNSMPQWIPAKSHNRIVTSKIRIPFTFDID